MDDDLGVPISGNLHMKWSNQTRFLLRSRGIPFHGSSQLVSSSFIEGSLFLEFRKKSEEICHPRKPQGMSPEDFAAATHALAERGQEVPNMSFKDKMTFLCCTGCIWHTIVLWQELWPAFAVAVFVFVWSNWLPPWPCESREDIALLRGYGSNPDTRLLSGSIVAQFSQGWVRV